MAEVLLFHHAQGLTPGVRAFADELRAAEHTVHTPDLYDGATFETIDPAMQSEMTITFTLADVGGGTDVTRCTTACRPASRSRTTRWVGGCRSTSNFMAT